MKKTYMPPFAEKIYFVEEGHLLISTNDVDEIPDNPNTVTGPGSGGSNNEEEPAKAWGQLWEADWD